MFPRWLSWMFLFAMGYVIFSASQGGNPVVQPATQPIVPAITHETYPALAQVTDLERWKRKLNPDYASVTNCSLDGLAAANGLEVKVIIEKSGEGAPASCGDTIRIHLTIWSDTGAKAYSEELALTLGTRSLAAGLDFALLGMRRGEARGVILPPYALAHAKTENAPKAARAALGKTRVVYATVKRID